MESEILDEVMDEIESSLKDPLGIARHQRRLAFSLSIGSTTLFEEFFKKQNLLKPGAKINHQWLKKSKGNVKLIISKYLTAPVNEIKNLNKVLDIVYEIEKERNELAYGKIVSEEKLKEKISLFLKLKKIIENA